MLLKTYFYPDELPGGFLKDISRHDIDGAMLRQPKRGASMAEVVETSHTFGLQVVTFVMKAHHPAEALQTLSNDGVDIILAQAPHQCAFQRHPVSHSGVLRRW